MKKDDVRWKCQIKILGNTMCVFFIIIIIIIIFGYD